MTTRSKILLSSASLLLALLVIVAGASTGFFPFLRIEEKLSLAYQGEANPISMAMRSQIPLSELEQIIIQNQAYLNQPSRSGVPPLTEAAGMGDVELVELLLASGADVTERHSTMLVAPLHIAVDATHAPGNEEADLAVISLLLSYGADPHQPNAYGYTPYEDTMLNVEARQLFDEFLQENK